MLSVNSASWLCCLSIVLLTVLCQWFLVLLCVLLCVFPCPTHNAIWVIVLLIEIPPLPLSSLVIAFCFYIFLFFSVFLLVVVIGSLVLNIVVVTGSLVLNIVVLELKWVLWNYVLGILAWTVVVSYSPRFYVFFLYISSSKSLPNSPSGILPNYQGASRENLIWGV